MKIFMLEYAIFVACDISCRKWGVMANFGTFSFCYKIQSQWILLSGIWEFLCARVAELVDALDLGSSGATRESSSLSFRTKVSNKKLEEH